MTETENGAPNERFHTVAQLIGSRVVGTQGVLGQVLDAFFDETSWQIRYLLIEVSVSGRDRALLFPPEEIVRIDAEEGNIHIDYLPPFDLAAAERLSSLRSTREVLDCAVAGWACDIGRTEDALFELDSWVLRFLMVDASSWCPGGVVLIRSDLIEEAQWERQSLRIAVTRVEILSMPESDDLEAADAAHDERVLH